ncbi:ATPase [Rhodococcus coprophilus]|uniref:ATPase n=2 Tax=Rhodococcus coprophilus TaxID=38310 RepID=A0A2X4XC43_9NOCA|nr:ATPase [Rhodococcus coprophilus]
MSVFDTTAQELGFALDAAQQRAVAVLAGSDRNVYLWGPVGRGKSWLMATYFAAVPTDRKKRIHFHEFFRDLHLAIRRHRSNLSAALDELLSDVDLLCFDEFHVHDPADGKFIARLVPALLERRIRVVLTSNYPPWSLLPNPLFHDDFLPTIELIESSLTVVAIDGALDYRTTSRHEGGFAAGWWVTPGTAEQRAHLGLCPPDHGERTILVPAGHAVHARRVTEHSVWFDFGDLCGTTTAPADYLALATSHREWVIDEVPDLRTAGREAAQRFANLVDVLYDQDVTPVFLAATPVADLIAGARLRLDIARIASRLGQLGAVEAEEGSRPEPNRASVPIDFPERGDR